LKTDRLRNRPKPVVEWEAMATGESHSEEYRRICRVAMPPRRDKVGRETMAIRRIGAVIAEPGVRNRTSDRLTLPPTFDQS